MSKGDYAMILFAPLSFPARIKNITLIFIAVIIFVFSNNTYGQNFDESKVPISNVFHNIGRNALHSITYNHGLNFIGAGLETLVFIETGADWAWRNVSYNDSRLSDWGRPELYAGYVVPAITPIIVYTTGRFIEDEKLQVAGLALAQSLILTISVQSSLKMVTGRALPGIVTELDQTRSSRTDDFSGEFNWFDMNFTGGWPSGHTANAFAAAATIAEIYDDNIPLKIGVYSYAALIGVGVTLNVHWASEALAGALIGYAIGKTVGRDFNKLLNKNNKEDSKENNISFYFTTNAIGIKIII
jgi:membrane-associated phospholipid phosphatase